ncbi:hypothetical protein Tco_0008587 [Tanacetum coccineum]
MEKDPSIPEETRSIGTMPEMTQCVRPAMSSQRNEAHLIVRAICLPVALTITKTRDIPSSAKTLNIQRKPPTAPKEKKSGKGKQKTTELENSLDEDFDRRLSNFKIITKKKPWVPDAPDYDSEDDISWKSSDDDQDDEQAQDDDDADKNDVNETTQDDEDDDDHDDDKKVQDDDEHDVDETVQEDDDEELTESDDDGDDFVHPKLTTHDDDIIHEEETDEDDSRISSSDDEDSDNDVEGANVAGARSDEDATDEKDQGNEAVKDTNTDLDRRDAEMTDVILPQVQATQETEDTHVTLTPVNPDGQQQSSSVSSGFVSNMLNPNQDTGVDDIFGQHTEATSLIDTSVTAIMEPSFTAQIKSIRPPTSQTNHYAEALSSIPSTTLSISCDKMQEVVAAVQIEVCAIIKGIHNTHAVAANLSELELKKILIDKMEANNSINKVQSDIQRQLYKEIQEPSAGTDTGSRSKRQRAGKEPDSTMLQVKRQPIDQERLPCTDLRLTEICPTCELMKGTCKSLTKLEYICEEVYKATTEKLDWINPEASVTILLDLDYYNEGMICSLTSSKKALPQTRGSKTVEDMLFLLASFFYLLLGARKNGQILPQSSLR